MFVLSRKGEGCKQEISPDMSEEREGARSLPPPQGAEAMFTPYGTGQKAAPRHDFSGFGEEMERGKDYVLRRQIDLEREMRAMGERGLSRGVVEFQS